MKISGIYQIQSKCKPNRIYIGSAVDIHQRWQRHLYILRRNEHHSKMLQNHYNKYGKNDLIFSILIGCAKEDLISTEQFFLDTNKTYFNTCRNAGNTLGSPAWNKGEKGIYSEETKQKMREAAIRNGNKPPGFKGRTHTEEVKQKLKLAWIKRNHTFSKETRTKMKGRIPWNKGMSLSDEAKQKLSLSHKGQIPWNKGLKTKNRIKQAS